MKFSFSLLISLFLLFPIHAAKKKIATVDIVKGRVTQLAPGALKAVEVQKGDSLLEDTSLVTSDNSMVRLSFVSGTTVVLAKAGKIVLRETPKEAKEKEFITLLNGKVRAAVKKSLNLPNPKASKLIIKTKTAALGVRGTEFITVFNPENQVTSLVTLEGEVAMKKIVKKRGLIKESQKTSVEDFSKMDMALSEEDAVVVKKGRYSGVNSNFLKATVPQKISPVQYLALKKNENLEVVKDIEASEQFSKEEVAKAAKEINSVKADDPNPQGLFNEKTGEFAPKAGGVLDTETGIYIQPTKEAKFDRTLKTFVMDENAGGVTASGDYKAPQGMVLTAKSGFIAKDKTAKKEVEKLNENIATAIPIDSKKEEVIKEKAKQIAKDQVRDKSFFLAQNFIFRFGGANYEAIVEPSAGEMIENQDFVSDSGSHLFLQWDQAWNASVTSSFGIGVSSYEFPDTALNFGKDDEEEGLVQLHASLIYYFNSWFGLRGGLEIKDVLLPRVVIQNTQRFNTGVLGTSSRILLGPEIRPYDNSWMRLQLGLYFMAVNKIEEDLDEVNEKLTMEGTNGARFKLETDFKFFKDWWLGLFVHYDEFESDLRQDASSQGINTTRNTRIQDAQVGLSFTYHL